MKFYEELKIEFTLESLEEGPNAGPFLQGSMTFGNGQAFRDAATWCRMQLDEFLYRTIEERLVEVQAAMGEECKSEVKDNEPTDRY